MQLLSSRRDTPTTRLTVTVYTRKACGCCRKALERIHDAQRLHGFTVEEVDVDSDPELTGRHGDSVPVVSVDGKIRFRGVVNPLLLERLLAAADVSA